MLDRVIIKATITEAEAEEIAKCANLQSYIKGGITHYETTNKDRFKGVYIIIKGGSLKVRFSVHKHFNLFECGCLENDNMLTMDEAKKTFYKFIDLYKLPIQKLYVTDFEIGLNIPLCKTLPIEHLKLIQHLNIGKAKDEKTKVFFEDANYKQLRQKTSRKDKDKKKVFKVYDKGFEIADRKRIPYNGENKTLKIETTYRRQKKTVGEFLSDKNINKITSIFFEDWGSVQYERETRTLKSFTTTQKYIAEEIESIGDNEYLKHIKEQKSKKLISERQYRTKKDFFNKWNENKVFFIKIASIQETEYKDLFSKQFYYATKKH